MNIQTLITGLTARDEGKHLLVELEGRRCSSPKFAERVTRLASGLLGLKLPPKAVVGILATNSIAYAEALCATICAGLISAPLNLRWSLNELDYAVSDAEIGVLFVDANFLPVAQQLQTLNGRIRDIVLMGAIEAPDGVIAGETLFGVPMTLDCEQDPLAPCLISYTGGTTGFPKGVVHTHRSVLAAATNMAIAAVPGKRMSYLIGVPMFHVSGFGFLFTRLLQTGTMVILPQFRPDLVSAAVRDLQVEEMGLVPTMLQMLISDPAFNPSDFASIKRIYYGASPISEALLEQIMATFEGVELVQVYGMTEVGVVISLSPQFHSGELARLKACGQAMALTTIRIEDDKGRECGVGETGELVHYGPTLMSHYHKKPDETAETFRHGGLRSGDAGFKDEMGVIFLQDRVKDMIVSGGENVYSAEVENAIASHPEVAMVAVIGIPDERFGEAVHAVIVPKPGCTPILEAIRAHAQALIAGYKCPRSIELRDGLPMSAMNKVLKAELRKAFARS